MSAVSFDQRAVEFSLTQEEFDYICKLVYDTTGIVLDERKREMIYRRLMKRLRETGLKTFSSYYQKLRQDEQELPAFINSITTNLTSFFRENHHFEFLEKQVFPELEKSKESRRIRIWSAACSTGEEPYSIAITLREALGSRINQWDAKILATDLDSECIQTAASGVYRSERIASLTEARQRQWFMRSASKEMSQVKVKSALTELIAFKTLNLLSQWPMKGPFDVIFCRNVLIYFDRETQSELIARYHGLLSANGYLMLGHSESLPRECNSFEVVGRTIFRKV